MEQSSGPHNNTKTSIAAAATLLLLAVSVYTHFIAAGVGDTQMLIINAQMLLEGKRLYADIFTVQPPLITWLYALPVSLAQLLHIPASAMIIISGLCLVLFSALICDRVLRFHPIFAHDEVKRRQHFGLLCLLFVAFTSPPYFFDREHIFMLLTLPYLLRCMPSLSGSRLTPGLRIAVGFMAGIGFCVKPHCVIIFAAVQLLYVLKKRSCRILLTTENRIVYAVGIAYIGSIFLLTPEYVNIVLPMAFQTYSAASVRINGVFFVAVAGTLLGVAFVDFSWRAVSPLRQDICYLLALCPAFLLYALANNGWGYAYNLFITMILILTGWLRMEYLWLKREAQEHGLPARSFMFGARACTLSLSVVILYSVASALFAVSSSCTQHLKCTRAGRELVAAMDGKHSFGAISGDFDIWARLTDATGAHWDTRFNHLWMLPEFFLSGDDFTRRHAWILNYVAGAFAEDMDRRKPDIMFVDDTDIFYIAPVHVDLIAYFSAFPAFRAAWAHYAYEESISTCRHPEKMHCSFKVYRRIP